MTTRRALALPLLLCASTGLWGAADAAPAFAGLANSAWPMFSHDAQHSGRASVNGPQGPAPQVAWQSRTRSRMRAAVSVGEDGTIFVPNGKNPLSAFDPATGAEIWESSNHQGGLADHSQPAVGDDGNAVAQVEEGLRPRDGRLVLDRDDVSIARADVETVV